MKNVTIFHKTVDTGVDPHLIMTLKYRKIKFKPRIKLNHNNIYSCPCASSLF